MSDAKETVRVCTFLVLGFGLLNLGAFLILILRLEDLGDGIPDCEPAQVQVELAERPPAPQVEPQPSPTPQKPSFSFKTDAAPGVSVVTAPGYQQGVNDIVVFDPQSLRLAIYQHRDGTLELKSVRSLEYDLRFMQYPRHGQRPSVRDVRKATSKRR